jgi:methanogenic corrinoid protein MtbC1
VQSALAGDFNATTTDALEFMAAMNSRLAVVTDLFHAASLHIADRWHLGDATAHDEYRVYQAIEAAMAALPAPTPRRAMGGPPRVLLATVWPEDHDLGLRLVGAALSDVGWHVDYASRTIRSDLVTRAASGGYSLVGISATYIAGRIQAELAATIADVHRFGTPVIVGGSAFIRQPLLADRTGADAVASDARLAVALASRIAGLDHRRSHRAS